MYVVDSGIRTTHQEFISASTGQKRATFGCAPAFCAPAYQCLAGHTVIELACWQPWRALCQWWLQIALLLRAGWTSSATSLSHLPSRIVSAPLLMGMTSTQKMHIHNLSPKDVVRWLRQDHWLVRRLCLSR